MLLGLFMALTLKKWNIAIGDKESLLCIMGLNVLEDRGLALEVGQELKRIARDLNISFVFKASWDKANRSSINSYRGPGLDIGLAILESVKRTLDVPIATDIHEPTQAARVSEIVDLIQIPAFLCRQTDLIVAAASAAIEHGGLLHIKKAQFMAPQDCSSILDKVKQAAGEQIAILCERGSSFGYNNLVVDMLGIPMMKNLGVPVTIDATHAVQLPGTHITAAGMASGGRRDGVPIIAGAAIAAGANGVFLEFHPDPDNAKCDGPSCLPLSSAETLLRRLKALHAVHL